MASFEKFEKEREKRILSFYDSVPESAKSDLWESLLWAKNVLTEREGSGHTFNVIADLNGSLRCAFAKPKWSGDHCGRSMETDAEAIVMAVCEYLNGG